MADVGDAIAQTKELLENFREELQRQAAKQAATWTIGMIGGLLAIAAAGWWFYLKERLPDFVGGVPKDAVIAFATTCPTTRGWSEYQEAKGRFVLGVGKGPLKQHVGLETPGGHELHILTVEEMPSHGHRMNRSSAGDDASKGVLGDVHQDGEKDIFVERTGGGKPHNNMPPYIALYFCKKD